MRRFLLLFPVCLLAVLLLGGCAQSGSTLTDGYYTAEAAGFDQYGWKEYVTICVNDDRIVSVEFDAFNASGFIKSWDMDYMREMNNEKGTYPNEYARQYTAGMVARQSAEAVDAISGATHSYEAFQLLAQACLEQARAGGDGMIYVDISEIEEAQKASEGGTP